MRPNSDELDLWGEWSGLLEAAVGRSVENAEAGFRRLDHRVGVGRRLDLLKHPNDLLYCFFSGQLSHGSPPVKLYYLHRLKYNIEAYSLSSF